MSRRACASLRCRSVDGALCRAPVADACAVMPRGCFWGLVLDSDACRRIESVSRVNVSGRWWLYPSADRLVLA